MMKVAADEIVDVISVRNCLMPAASGMRMRSVVRSALVRRRAGRRMRDIDCNRALVDMIAVRFVQMPIVHVVEMIPVSKGRVPAVRAMLMRV
jgi:hypothetical protein